MKLSARDAAAYFKKPDPSRTGLLLYGGDAKRISHRRQEVVAALIGPQGDEEMRLTRINAAELRKETALLLDGVKAVGFFPGPRVVLVEDAGDGLAPTIAAALSDWQEGDAQIVVTAGQLAAKSKLRKLFEDHPNAYATGIYDDPPSRAEIEAELHRAGLSDVSADALDALTALSRVIGPGDFRQTLEKIALYKHGDPAPLSVDEVELSAPSSYEAALDDAIELAVEGRTEEIGPVLRRLEAQGVSAVGLCIGATRQFRQLHRVASAPGGAGQGIGLLRPPVFGPRRDRMMRQASNWGMHKLERALALLLETDLTLRSTRKVPEMAVMERALLRLAWMGRQR